MADEYVVIWSGSRHHPAGRQLLVEEEARIEVKRSPAGRAPKAQAVPSRPETVPVHAWLERL